MTAATQRAWIGLGSNLDNPKEQVVRAFAALHALPGSVCLQCSSLYRTAPIGGPPSQPDYCNAVAEIATKLAPHALLRELQAIEQSAGRERTQRWGARTLDLDVLLYGGLQLDELDLVIPHPRLHQRAFVLAPLAELAPDLTIPGTGRVADLLDGVAGQGVEPWDMP